MITHSFQFSSAAKLYVKHLASIKEIRDSKSKDAKNLYAKYVKIVKEMRAETYRNIAEFGRILLELLGEKEGLAHKETAPVGQFAGGKIHYLWIEKTKDKEKKRRVREVPMVSFALPIPNKVQDNNDATWETYWGAFDMIGADRIKVWVVYDCSDSWSKQLILKQLILGLAKNKDFGIFHEEEVGSYWSWIPLKSDNPVGSAAERLKSLIDAVYTAQKRQ